MRLLALLSATLLATGLAHAGQDLAYADGKTPLKGYYNQPADASATDKHPAVLVVHQWMGLTDYEKGRVDQIVKDLDYAAFAADIYGPDAPKDMASAGAAAGKYKGDIKLYRARVKAALDAMKKQPGVDASKIAVIGYCFGGMGALEAARAQFPVKAVISFHGALTYTAQERGSIKASVLALHGADDPYVKADEVAGFEAEMRARKADWQLVKYSGAVHAFTQPGAGNDNKKGAAYNAVADKRSWAAMKTFLADQFGR